MAINNINYRNLSSPFNKFFPNTRHFEAINVLPKWKTCTPFSKASNNLKNKKGKIIISSSLDKFEEANGKANVELTIVVVLGSIAPLGFTIKQVSYLLV